MPRNPGLTQVFDFDYNEYAYFRLICLLSSSMVAKVPKQALSDLCKLIVKDQSLQEATIISAEVYVEYRMLGGYHTSLVLELHCSGSETLYLRLDGRSPLVSEVRDLEYCLMISESLVCKCTMKSRQTFSSVVTLGELQNLLRDISDRTAIVRPMAYDRFFALLLQHYLEKVDNGVFAECKMKCSVPHQICETLRLHYGIPTSFSLIELLRSLQRCRENYPRLTQSSVSKALGLATAWNPSPDYDTARGQALAHELAINIQSITKQLDHSVHAAQIRLLWEESAELLRRLHERDPAKYNADFSCTLYCLGAHLRRTDSIYWGNAENLLREASRLYRKRYADDSASKDNCIHLALTLQEHAESLEKLGQNELAKEVFLEALGLLRKLFYRVGMCMRDYGDFIFADGETRFRLGQGLHHPGGVANICSSRGCLLCTKYAERGA